MTNPQKKKKPEVLIAWNSLKEQIIRLVKHGIVYRKHKGLETITGQELLQRKLQAHEGYESQLKIEQKKYILLEKKLDQVKDLITDNKIEKLKHLIKKGEI